MLLGFKQRFVPFVENGSKRHTIRARRAIPPKAGEICHCYTGLRRKGARLLGRWPCLRVEEIAIRGDWSERKTRIWIEGESLSPHEACVFAWTDGFRTHGEHGAFQEMLDYWREGNSDPALDFYGHLIHWDYEHPVKKLKSKREGRRER